MWNCEEMRMKKRLIMKISLEFVVLILVGICLTSTNGMNIVDETFKEGLQMMNTTEMESSVFENFCETCKWGEYISKKKSLNQNEK